METFAVALVGEEDRGWRVEAASTEEAIDIVHGTVPQAWPRWPERAYLDILKNLTRTLRSVVNLEGDGNVPGRAHESARFRPAH